MHWKRSLFFIVFFAFIGCEPINSKLDTDGNKVNAFKNTEGVFVAHEANYSCQSYSENPNNKIYGFRAELRIFDSRAFFTDGCSDAIEVVESSEAASIQLSSNGNTLLFRNKAFKRFELAIPSALNRMEYTLSFPNYTCVTDINPPSTIASYVDKIIFDFAQDSSATYTYLGNQCNDALEMEDLEEEWLISHDKQQLLGRKGVYQLTLSQ